VQTDVEKRRYRAKNIRSYGYMKMIRAFATSLLSPIVWHLVISGMHSQARRK
jgi:hypothetical protein